MKVTVLAESSCVSFISKPIDIPQQCPGLSQVGAATFFTIYLTFPYFLLSLWVTPKCSTNKPRHFGFTEFFVNWKLAERSSFAPVWSLWRCWSFFLTFFYLILISLFLVRVIVHNMREKWLQTLKIYIFIFDTTVP